MATAYDHKFQERIILFDMLSYCALSIFFSNFKFVKLNFTGVGTKG